MKPKPRQKIRGDVLRLGDLALPMETAIQRSIEITRGLEERHPRGSKERRELEVKRRLYDRERVTAIAHRAVAEHAAKRQSAGGIAGAATKREDAAERRRQLLTAAASIRAAEPGIKQGALARMLADRGHGAASYIVKVLRQEKTVG